MATAGDHSARWFSTPLRNLRTWRRPATTPPGGSLRTYGTEGLGDGRRPLRPVVLYGLMGQRDLATAGDHSPSVVLYGLMGQTNLATAGDPSARWLSTDLWDRGTWRRPATTPPGGSLRTYGTEELGDGRRPLRPVVLYGLMGQTNLPMTGRGWRARSKTCRCR